MVVNDKLKNQTTTDNTFSQNTNLMQLRQKIMAGGKYNDDIKNKTLNYIRMILDIVTPIIKPSV